MIGRIKDTYNAAKDYAQSKYFLYSVSPDEDIYVILDEKDEELFDKDSEDELVIIDLEDLISDV